MFTSVMEKTKYKIYCVIPNFNGEKYLKKAVDSLINQTVECKIVVVDNYSTDGSLKVLSNYKNRIEVINLDSNTGFTGGVNAGIRVALDNRADFVALFNNDAVAENNWIKNLVSRFEQQAELGIITSKIMSIDKKYFDSTGDFYTSWGMPFPRGRNEAVSNKYDDSKMVFSASGCASLYRSEVFSNIGLFDDDFFAYFEDVDISYRAQLAGIKIGYEPSAIVWHRIGSTSSKISGFGAYQTAKNLPLLFIKNTPLSLIPHIGIRFFIFYWTLFLSSLFKPGLGLPVMKGALMAFVLTPKALYKRHRIQKNRVVSSEYIESIIIHDLPPDSKKLRKLRKIVTGK